MQKAFTGVMLLSLLLLSLWIRLLPRQLLSATDRAVSGVRNELETDVLRRLPRSGVRSQRKAALSLLLDRWMHQHESQIKTQTALMAQRIREDLTYSSANGRTDPYLGGYDSYLWLRYARTWRNTGSPCDAIVDDTCRDTHTLAPVGAVSPYARRLHSAALAGFQYVLTRFQPQYSLLATAFLLSVIVGATAVLPAFFLGRRVGGNAGGIYAAIFLGVHPAVLARTMAGDNDIWNLVLPLYALWATSAALAAERAYQQLGYAMVTCLLIGLQAWAWSGWVFLYAVTLAGCASVVVLQGLHFIFTEKTGRIWRAAGVRHSGLILLSLYIGSAISTAPTAGLQQYFGLPKIIFEALQRAVAGDHQQAASHDLVWPNAFSTVAETARMQLSDICHGLGGGAVLLLALLGLVLLALPRDQWRGWKVKVLAASGILYCACLFVRQPDPRAALLIFLAPVLVALLITSLKGGLSVEREGMACLLAVWMMTALYMSFHGVRFLLLLAPPVGLAAAAALGHAARGALRYADHEPRWYRRITYATVAAVVLIIVSEPVALGYPVAREYAPDMNDAWWDALTRLRDNSAPDSIVHTWWDYGDWVTDVAERRVDNDGTSLQTHVPVWVAKALAASREQDSVGLLRMLGCGSDATPLTGGERGGYGKLLKLPREPLEAYRMLTSLIRLNRTDAEASLTQSGVSPADRNNILTSTHCTPPDSYLILSSKMVDKRDAWMRFARWNPSVPQADEKETAVPFSTQWLPCQEDATKAGISCTIQSEVASRPELFDQFLMSSANIPRLTSSRGGSHIDAPPATVIRAEKDGLHETRFPESPYPDLGVLLDSEHNRILIGAPDFLQSTFVQLMYLDGRYATHYRKVDERTAAGERVATWRIDWGANEPDTPAPRPGKAPTQLAGQ